MTDPTIYHICDHCHYEFTVNMVKGNGVDSDWGVNVTKCTHCNKENEMWIRLRSSQPHLT